MKIEATGLLEIAEKARPCRIGRRWGHRGFTIGALLARGLEGVVGGRVCHGEGVGSRAPAAAILL